MRNINECIDSRAFAVLILDYESAGDDVLPPYASGRILIDGLYKTAIVGTDRDDLIRKFRNNEW